MCIHICTIINKSLQAGDVPRSRKIAKVIQIHTSKAKIDLGNYRPISLLPSLSYLLDKIVRNNNNNNIQHIYSALYNL
ncbi:hypothetical protein LSH36_531g01052 [Paralvinella palmiformis]|uniref:Uncharacterized protein n=1 Tax=Paralvinella palmiformis TaxID=53620 RepID=A0AAD9J756_9ANNE|nr:hypothetical protein LSH36_531g01052 [Paralvinella palmiformis]